jgi:hypothetical protein
MDLDGRTPKRRKVTPAPALLPRKAESNPRGYLTLARAEFAIVAQDAPLEHLDESTSPASPRSVEIRTYSGASLLSLSVAGSRRLEYWSIIESCTDSERQLLDECVRLAPVSKYDIDCTAGPVACHHATITHSSTNPAAYTLTASIAWRDDKTARDKLRDEQ